MTSKSATASNSGLLKRAILGFATFSGRSQRTEVAYLWIAVTLFRGLWPFEIKVAGVPWLGEAVIDIVSAIPIFAQFVRRLHDQDRSGWWAMLLPLAYLFNIQQIVARYSGDVSGVVAAQGTPPFFAALLCMIAVFALSIFPGTVGPNRYGPDPRLSSQ